ncbi:ACP S-malonyltransferase [Puia dinghuensis]|uniref:[acyl-carrier-protein] S-malonyltransferase n=1 Tax=Puia dinghuensis TaxID=1792502 RepID=A0A8J2U643_9BACT|nr:ACP S-malonyltransferase [Puia dinghuensis]GGA81037.1 hypothetical protein GCM10011511_00020 [Puia dinghuensis]
MKKIALLFPGQGINLNRVGDLVREKPRARAIFEEAGDLIRKDLLKKVDQKSTEIDQALIVTANVAYFECYIKDQEFVPAIHYMAGHSLGEYSALICGDVLPMSEVLPLLEHRQREMNRCAASVKGKMIAIHGVSDKSICQHVDLLRKTGRRVNISAFNAPGQTVISGEKSDVEIAAAEITRTQGRYTPLDINGPLHSDLMTVAKNIFSQYTEQLHPKTPKSIIYSSISGTQLAVAEEIPGMLSQQLNRPVLWQQLIDALIEKGVHLFINVGPDKMLENLMTNHWPQVTCRSLVDKESRASCAAYIKDEMDSFISPVTRCLVNAVSSGPKADKDNPASSFESYNSIWDIQLRVEHRRTVCTSGELDSCLYALTTILHNKGLEDREITRIVDGIKLETGLESLYTMSNIEDEKKSL